MRIAFFPSRVGVGIRDLELLLLSSTPSPLSHMTPQKISARWRNLVLAIGPLRSSFFAESRGIFLSLLRPLVAPSMAATRCRQRLVATTAGNLRSAIGPLESPFFAESRGIFLSLLQPLIAPSMAATRCQQRLMATIAGNLRLAIEPRESPFFTISSSSIYFLLSF